MNCYQAKANELTKQWYVVDATEQVVGRLAAQIAPILMGKHRPTYTAHIDTGDYVIVTNVEKVVFTGNKWTQKSYQRYSGHPGGQKEEQAFKLLKRRPERILELAIQRMMPKNKIGRHMMSKLKLVVGPKHDHQAQSPIPLAPLSGRPTAAGGLFVVPEVDAIKVPTLGRGEPAVAPVAESTMTPTPEPVSTPVPTVEHPAPTVEHHESTPAVEPPAADTHEHPPA